MADEVPLESDTFWCTDPSVLRLRACHVMAWTAGLGALTLAVPLQLRGNAGGTRGRHRAAGGQRRRPGDRGADHGVESGDRARRRRRRLADAPTAAAAVGSLGLLVASLVWVATADVAYPPAPTHFPGLRGAIYVLLVHTGRVADRTVRLHRIVDARAADGVAMTRATGTAPSLGGFTAPFVALIAWLIGGGFSVGRRPVDRAGARQGGAVHGGGRAAKSPAGRRHSPVTPRPSPTRSPR